MVKHLIGCTEEWLLSQQQCVCCAAQAEPDHARVPVDAQAADEGATATQQAALPREPALPCLVGARYDSTYPPLPLTLRCSSRCHAKHMKRTAWCSSTLPAMNLAEGPTLKCLESLPMQTT